MKSIYEDDKITMNDEDNNLLGYITFPKSKTDENAVMITSTFVDSKHRGEGIAAKLVNSAYEHIKSEDKKVIPSCSYAKTWFENNPDKQDILYK